MGDVARVGLLSPEVDALLARAEAEHRARLAEFLTPEAVEYVFEMERRATAALVLGTGRVDLRAEFDDAPVLREP